MHRSPGPHGRRGPVDSDGGGVVVIRACQNLGWYLSTPGRSRSHLLFLFPLDTRRGVPRYHTHSASLLSCVPIYLLPAQQRLSGAPDTALPVEAEAIAGAENPTYIQRLLCGDLHLPAPHSVCDGCGARRNLSRVILIARRVSGPVMQAVQLPRALLALLRRPVSPHTPRARLRHRRWVARGIIARGALARDLVEL